MSVADMPTSVAGWVPLQVSGEILLACRWRITPLDEVQLKLKACQFELEQKEEMLALLYEHLRTQNATGLNNGLDSASDIPETAVTDGQRKRLHATSGTLDVKVNDGPAQLASSNNA